MAALLMTSSSGQHEHATLLLLLQQLLPIQVVDGLKSGEDVRGCCNHPDTIECFRGTRNDWHGRCIMFMPPNFCRGLQGVVRIERKSFQCRCRFLCIAHVRFSGVLASFSVI